jgi:hypothetical protein
MATHAVQPAGAAARSYEHTERVGFAIFMIVAPLIALAATIIHPPHGAENPTQYYQAAHDHSDRFYASHTLFFFAAVAMLPAIIGLARLVQRSHPKQAFWGMVLSAMGMMAWGCLDGFDFMTYIAGSSSNLDSATMQQYIDDVDENSAVLIPVSAVFLLLIVGLTFLVVGLARAGIIGFWHALLFPIGVIGLLSFLEYPPLLIGSGLLLCASLGLIGVRQLRAPDDAAASQPAPA